MTGPLKGALHTHTTKSDGKLTPEEVLRAHRDQGYDFIALTDHDFLMMPTAYRDVPDEFEGMLVFKGVERTIFARGYLHYNEIPGDNEVLRIFNHPAEYDFTVPQVIERLDEIRRSVEIHACEVSEKGFYTPAFDIPEIDLPKVVSDDSHTREAIGRAWVEVECARERDAILRAIKAGAARNVYHATAHAAQWNAWGGI
jgi:histidinol phosphatase-like PHP family hydrolase